jgi:hypothetical protein
MQVRIDRCRAGDIDDVVRFVDEHWQPGHPLVACRALLDWQHRDPDGRGYSFVVARRESDGVVLGILGYIPTRRFDAALDGHNVVWLTMWKVRDDANVAGLGLQLLHHVARAEPHVAMGAVGLNAATLPIYRALGYRTGELRHYARVNAAARAVRLTSLRPAAPAATAGSPLDARRLTSDADFAEFASLTTADRVPRKTAAYFHARYARHPFYTYDVLGLRDGGRPIGLLAARVAEHDGCRALRIVDVLGAAEVLPRIGPAVQQRLEESDAEYADVYNAGIDPDVFARGGFGQIDPDGAEIVPDHFEPFERRNVRLWYSLKGSAVETLFKADGDQDRPNRVPQPMA